MVKAPPIRDRYLRGQSGVNYAIDTYSGLRRFLADATGGAKGLIRGYLQICPEDKTIPVGQGGRILKESLRDFQPGSVYFYPVQTEGELWSAQKLAKKEFFRPIVTVVDECGNQLGNINARFGLGHVANQRSAFSAFLNAKGNSRFKALVMGICVINFLAINYLLWSAVNSDDGGAK